MNIGDIYIENPVLLAPMAGFTDVAFRSICKSMGCGLTYTEMVSAKALYYGNENTQRLLMASENEKPLAVQIFGSDPYIMANIAEKLSERESIDIIDINMGCPALKIIKNGEGSALMKNPKLAFDIVREVSKASKKPVTVKIRKGFTKGESTAVDFAKGLEEAGAKAITVHGRTREQMYQGKADWNIIKEVKSALSIPVIGNGDVFSANNARELIELSGCDGVMVARGALGNPWIFNEIKDMLNGKDVINPTPLEKVDLCIQHYKKSLEYDKEEKAVREMRKHIALYIKGLKNCTDIKNDVNICKESKEVIDILQRYKESLKDT
ncbi:tRNA dihydrouridine synthase DusB [Clostridium algidicarnis]|uniref:tRNA-dihydrouridine synthase n=2 Tax=Clostridium algidicarnis TaxID=37659 RepID=A0A2S6FZ85_9CLOT|nr:tRNA dihydrouridine synthase DusB [Clostridium algidicarnis]MBB6632405.1 tRNA dihydrouridine synthase DusB [Clostridium algidicarnis]MBU3193207.1 tRNA dihydrouridine synthase DusB [Clostridium algidicarnis]MBU3218950.1 tRNA dihydrouridine synthase DusB [Clostridium algidicarnis]MCB2287993.1 tRNA dihydrouridine synthase DusB [Clostridium algidicarnis]PPK48864.1 tRNA-U20-dihydrouridine synthase [Clostridium algidicarnis DSM 15099]